MTDAVTWTIGEWTAGVTDRFGVEWHVATEEGWQSTPDMRTHRSPRPARRGAFRGPSYRSARSITLEGSALAPTPEALEHAATRLAAVLSDGQELGTLIVRERDYTRQCDVELDAGTKITKTNDWTLVWSIQLAAPDPVRYAAVLRQLSTTLPFVPDGGLTFPLTFPLNFGPLPQGGQLTVHSSGTADTWPVFKITGPITGPIISSETTGDRLLFDSGFAVGADQTLTIDTDNRLVLLAGSATRRGQLEIAEWFPIRAGATTRIGFGSAGDYNSQARLKCLWRDGWW